MRWRGLSSVIAAFLVIVGSWKGYLALFDPGKQEPKQIFPRLVSSLPEADQKALEAGISVRNQRDSETLLEDSLS